ncbi:MAG: hypothetical protein WBV31_02995 [Terriglobales bacterium]|jgi:hypothetical protein
MSRIKPIFAVLMLTAIMGIGPLAKAATTVQATIAGASAMWQTVALAAYQEAGAGAGHWTSASNVVSLTDSRVTPANTDAGTIWIVWNSTFTKVWSYTKVDSVVGTRCYFAQPQCTVNATSTILSGSGANQISSNFWGADQALPAKVLTIFTTGTPVTVAATVVRPEDALFITCRANSSLGAGSYGGAASDGLDGLGYNSVNAPGVCPANGLGQGSGAYVGTPIKSGYPGSTGQANVLAFNISGVDPISGLAIPVYDVLNLGAAPLIFVTERDKGELTSLTSATPAQLQQAFSGANCDASAFGLPAGGINIFINEGISGQGNLAENTVFRGPTVYTGSGTGSVLGLSQEANVGSNNPLAGQTGTCLSGLGARYRAIGSSEETKSVQNSSAKFGGRDGIGYGIFSYGNFSTIANNTAYGYIQLNGVDPLFASYSGGDPGQPGNGTLPGAANLPAACSGAFPCPEKDIWTGGFSFPNLRNGTYGSWTILRFITNGKGKTATSALLGKSQAYVVTSVPDYVPAAKTVVAGYPIDPGLKYLHSHYQQLDGGGNLIGAAPANSGTAEAGGELGGCILASTSRTTQKVNDLPNPCVVRP